MRQRYRHNRYANIADTRDILVPPFVPPSHDLPIAVAQALRLRPSYPGRKDKPCATVCFFLLPVAQALRLRLFLSRTQG